MKLGGNTSNNINLCHKYVLYKWKYSGTCLMGQVCLGGGCNTNDLHKYRIYHVYKIINADDHSGRGISGLYHIGQSHSLH